MNPEYSLLYSQDSYVSKATRISPIHSYLLSLRSVLLLHFSPCGKGPLIPDVMTPIRNRPAEEQNIFSCVLTSKFKSYITARDRHRQAPAGKLQGNVSKCLRMSVAETSVGVREHISYCDGQLPVWYVHANVNTEANCRSDGGVFDVGVVS
jgi:hypothetical protein